MNKKLGRAGLYCSFVIAYLPARRNISMTGRHCAAMRPAYDRRPGGLRAGYHRKIERNRTAAKQAKKFHGTICQACDLNFENRYGAMGKGFIEAHHLKPIATLAEGVAVTYDVAADFAVLCANCHRMIHRSDDPSDLIKFRGLVQSIKS